MEEVRQIMANISRAWRNGRVHELDAYFHECMVIKGPGMREAARGKAACVESYREFLKQAKIEDYQESDLAVDIWNTTAIATYAWKMTYELAEKQYRESGHDTFAFTKDNGRWLAVWRLMLPSQTD